jgi:hypothetical protein
MNTKGLLPLWIVAVCGLILAGCGKGSDTQPAAAPSQPAGAAKAVASTGSAPVAKPETQTAPAPAPAAKPESGTASVAAKHPWGSFKVGSYVKTKTISKVEVAGMDPDETVTEVITTLVALDSENATLKMQVQIGGTEASTVETKVPLKAAGQVVDEQKLKEGAFGTETIEVAGKQLACRWVQTESEAEITKTVSKVWQCHDIPGFMAKEISTSTGKGTGTGNMKCTTTTEVVEFAAK